MGCNASQSVSAPKPAVAAQVVSCKRQVSPIKKETKFQWKDGSGWQNYDGATDARLKMAHLVGHRNARFKVKTKSGVEEYLFVFGKNHMTQKNVDSGRERQMRPPQGMFAPSSPLLPEGDFVVITLTADQVGKDKITITDPHKSNKKITVSIPANARKGQKIAVPIPSNGEKVEDIAKKQQGLKTGSKVAVGLGVSAAVGAGVVGGVILGDHLAGGTLAQDAGDAIVDVAEDIGDFAVDAGEAIGDFAEDAGDWLGDAGEDIGDWVCSVFD
jgi:hypothetical protein